MSGTVPVSSERSEASFLLGPQSRTTQVVVVVIEEGEDGGEVEVPRGEEEVEVEEEVTIR